MSLLWCPGVKSSGVITLTTDFGADSPYVAALKGVILSINPGVTIVDVTHSVPPQDVRAGAIVLADVARWFPPDTIHVAVVDPGVGTARKIVYAQIGRQHFVAPDNGLLSRLAQTTKPSRIIAVTEPTYWLEEVSTTFHGRDIMAPVAAHLSQGLDPELLGSPLDKLYELDWPQPRVAGDEITGQVIAVDSFGNLITNIGARHLADVPRDGAVRIECAGHTILHFVHAYGDQSDSSLVALIGSSGQLEVAVVSGNAAQTLGAHVGDAVAIGWRAGA